MSAGDDGSPWVKYSIVAPSVAVSFPGRGPLVVASAVSAVIGPKVPQQSPRRAIIRSGGRDRKPLNGLGGGGSTLRRARRRRRCYARPPMNTTQRPAGLPPDRRHRLRHSPCSQSGSESFRVDLRHPAVVLLGVRNWG